MEGPELRKYLVKRGLNLAQTARDIGISRQAFDNRFKGAPSLTFINELATATGLPVNDIINLKLKDDDNTTLNEPNEPYGNPKGSDMHKELLDVYRENRTLHNKLLQRDEYIAETLQKLINP